MDEHNVDRHFEGKDPAVRDLYSRLLAVMRDLGPVAEDPKKTSIHLNRNTAFAGVQVRKAHIVLTVKSDREWDSPRVHKSERTSARRLHHELKLCGPPGAGR